MKFALLSMALMVSLVFSAGAQEWDPYGEVLEDIFDPPARGSDNPALERELDRWDREEERAARRLFMQHLHEERARKHALSTCDTIWNNPEAAAACRDAYRD